MPHLRTNLFAAHILALGTCLASEAQAKEGMWMPNQTPYIAESLRAEGLALDPTSLSDLGKAPLDAIVSLGGCSGAFLSPQGLVATAHHCVYGAIQYVSTPDRDYLRDGFLAKNMPEEVPAPPGTRMFLLERLEDVTDVMLRGITSRTVGIDRTRKMEANRRWLIEKCERPTNRRCDVRSYFGGSSYWLQQQRQILDVRLVYAPASGLGNFGGETDNWMWPRHAGDFGFLRAYVAPDGSSAPYSPANIPYRPRTWLPVARTGVKAGDFVMVAGFPAMTNRLASAAEVKLAFEALLPARKAAAHRYVEQIETETMGDDAAAIAYASTLRGQQNVLKKIGGQLAGADRIDLLGRKAAQEQAFQRWVEADAQRQGLYGPALAEMDNLIEEERKAGLDDIAFDALQRGQLFASALTLLRWAHEREKSDPLRESGYQDRDRRSLVERLKRLDRRFKAKVDQTLFATAVAEYRKTPAASQLLLRAIDGLGMDRIYTESRLADPAERLAWLDKPVGDFEASNDPFIRLAVTALPGMLAAEDARKDREGRLQAVRSQYVQGLIAFASADGKTLYPDANGALRLAYGRVSGKKVDGESWAAFTTVNGLVAKHAGKGEFDAPAWLIAAAKTGDFGGFAAPNLGTLPVNFLSTLDITSGNSGSATMNAQGEFVGIAFDRTMDGILSDWAFDEASDRTVHVDSRFMLWTMEKVDGANRLLKEMGLEDRAGQDRSGSKGAREAISR
ncbi:S46 family peptidase [Sphingosinicella rhizophila]|uniref:Dipeptidyl-peptidase n=1 Tax=Sphingosinicella rhizophila TaxID=3050082 RepID=A0ABU3Q5G8_9SPHN|nr:S46 family peptidase [Sphingosinicella sp. GR2756]MDT9598656.1 S46 family peptidase [Sphingosinicella sp. GR2756]